eukprot:gene5632-6951_t
MPLEKSLHLRHAARALVRLVLVDVRAVRRGVVLERRLEEWYHTTVARPVIVGQHAAGVDATHPAFHCIARVSVMESPRVRKHRLIVRSHTGQQGIVAEDEAEAADPRRVTAPVVPFGLEPLQWGA